MTEFLLGSISEDVTITAITNTKNDMLKQSLDIQLILSKESRMLLHIISKSRNSIKIIQKT